MAIIAVVFIHNTPSGFAQVVIRPFLNFSVGLFLFLSGMLSNADNWNPVKRISKVVIPYVIWTFIYVVLSTYKTPLQIPVVFIKRLVLGDAAAIMYYIFVYCEFTLLIPLIDKLARSRYCYCGFVIAPIEIIVMRLMPLVLGTDLNKYICAIMSVSCLGWFTYYYLGYMMGNKLIRIDISSSKLILMCLFSILIQIAEGYWYLRMGETNCGTQLKLSAILTGSLFTILAYRFVHSCRDYNIAILRKLGDISFGIYFAHIAVMMVLGTIPLYSLFICYPLNAVITIIVTVVCIYLGKKILGKKSRYLAL